jgi:hypothetical protein
MLKRIAAATAMLCSVGAASAADWSIGALPTSPASYGTFVNHTVGDFIDTVSFSVPEGTLGVSANVLSVTDVIDGVGYAYHISDLTYSVWMGATQVGATYSGGLTPSYTSLLAGDYTLKITGDADGNFGGLYGLNLAVTPVPEPATYGMMMVGVGLLALTARRRKASNDKFE